MYGSGAADTVRFPVYAGGYPDAKFIFATPADKSEVVDYALPGFASFVRDARDVRFERCRAAVDGVEHRAAIARRDADVTGSCPPVR